MIYGPRTKYFESLEIYPSIFQGEIHAIERWFQFNFDKIYENQEIIMFDSQARISTLNSTIIISKTVLECLNKLNEQGKNTYCGF